MLPIARRARAGAAIEILTVSLVFLGALFPSSAASDGGYHSKLAPIEARGGLREFSVIYTDRATNSTSTTFQRVMKTVNSVLTEAYNAHRAVIMPGSGTFAMEAVARQFCTGKKALVVRLG